MTSSYVTNIYRLSGYVVAGGFLLRSAMGFAGATVLYLHEDFFWQAARVSANVILTSFRLLLHECDLLQNMAI